MTDWAMVWDLETVLDTEIAARLTCSLPRSLIMSPTMPASFTLSNSPRSVFALPYRGVTEHALIYDASGKAIDLAGFEKLCGSDPSRVMELKSALPVWSKPLPSMP
jgi:hypothetical protein